MSSSSNSCGADPALSVAEGGNRPRPKRRRALLRALALAPVFGLRRRVQAGTDLVADLKRWGSGEFRRFGLPVHQATLWAVDDPQRPPLALRLDYRRAVEGRVIATVSVREMRRFVSDETLLQHWGEQMQRIFPDVQAGDHLLGVHRADGLRFYQHERLLGSIATPGFSAALFGIWLDERTGVPALRAALLQRLQG